MAIPSHAVIVTAAGSSDRFNENRELGVKKEYLALDEHTVLYRSVRPFLGIPNCRAIIVTHPEGMEDQCAVALEDLLEQNLVPIILAKGGKNRQESVLNGLELLSTLSLSIEYVAIHDGARPYVSEELIITTLATATVFGGAVPALPATDAIKTIDEHGRIVGHGDRKQTVGVQTPQIFRYPEILEAHRRAAGTTNTYIDDTEIFTDYNQRVGICEGERTNIKITYLSDIPDAENQIERYLSDLEEGRRQARIHEAFGQALSQAKPGRMG
ncbi:MAG: 2-C-methyl-D-erythritol 4-phosphate cytidylyltransferase [Spirochaetales bacterium]|nr:2-C-methyl-D-erythritol 4-phosphate cytidylyltransferase [Spirochaetales bacterium]